MLETISKDEKKPVDDNEKWHYVLKDSQSLIALCGYKFGADSDILPATMLNVDRCTMLNVDRCRECYFKAWGKEE